MASFGIILVLLGVFIAYEAAKGLGTSTAQASSGNSVGGGGAASPQTVQTPNPQGSVGGPWEAYIPAGWGPSMQTLLGQENASGNPTNVNPVAVGNEHASGLWQMLPSTFAGNAAPNCSNIWDPVCNTIAAVNYIARRYGNPGNIPNLGNPSTYQGY